MVIIEDKNQKANKHNKKHSYWEHEGICVTSIYRLPVGDYIACEDKVLDMIHRKEERNVDVKMMDFLGTYTRTVDTKYGMQEMYSDIIGKDHARFRDECILAQNNGIELIILIEEPGITCLEDVAKWKNPRAEKWYKINAMHKVGKAMSVKIPKVPPCSSEKLMKSMQTMAEKYNVRFEFCHPDDAGMIITELLKEVITDD